MKTKKNVMIWVIPVLIVLLVGALALIQFSGTFSFLSITPLSISNVDIVDGGGKILVYARQGGGNEISIDFTPSKLNSYLNEKGYMATKSSKLTARFIEQNIKIPFSTSETDYNTIKLLKSPKSIGFNWGSCHISDCKNKGYGKTVAAYGDGYLANYDCYCVEEYNHGYTLSFNTGYLSKAFKVEWDLDGEKKIMESDYGSVNFGSKALIKWQGNLLGSNSIGVPNYDVYHVDTSWYLIDSKADSRVSSAYSNFITCTDKQLSKSQYNTCKSTYFDVIDNQITPQDSYYKNEVPNVRSISFSSGNMYVNLDKPTFLSTYTIELDATK